MTDQPLRGIRVLTTRPAHQSAELLAGLRALGAEADNLPTIEIMRITANKAQLQRVAGYHLVIFISGNAVSYGLAALADVGLPHENLPPAVAIGRSTARQLEQAGVAEVAYPAQPNSEAVCEMPVVKALPRAGKVLVFRGRGGKEVLARSLRARDLTVDYVEVYERRKPLESAANSFATAFSASAPDLILVTSRDSLQNLYRLTNAEQRRLLLHTQIVIGSPSMSDLHSELGFDKPPVIAASPLNDDMVRAAKEWCGDKVGAGLR